MKKRTSPLACLIVFAGMPALVASASTIAFDVAEDFGNVDQLLTDGTLVEAANIGTGAVDVTTSNGITFVGGTSVRLDIQNETDFADAGRYTAGTHAIGFTSITGLSASDEDALFDPLQFGSGGGSWNATWNGLTAGHKYAFDLLIVDDAGTAVIYVSNTTGAFDGPYDISDNAVQLITGTFLADDATQGMRVAIGGANNVQLNAYQLRDISGPTLIGDAGNGAQWTLTVPTLGAYDNEADGPSANFYFDADGDLDFNAVDGDTTGNTNASMALSQRVEDGDALNFYFEDFNFDLESVAGITLSGLDIELTNGTVLDNLSVTEGTPTLFFDVSVGQVWQITLDVIDGGGGGDIVNNLSSEPGGGGPDEQFVLTFTQVPTPAALPAGLALIGLLAARRKR